MVHSTAKVSRLKPDWRRSWGLSPDFPLFPLGDPDQPERLRWCKKVRKKLEYFGKVETDPKGQRAIEEWLRVKDALIAGRPRPSSDSDGVTLKELCNKFLASKRINVTLGKLSPRTFVEYSRTTNLLIESFGKDRPVHTLAPSDFEKLYATLAGKHGIITLGKEVCMVRTVFKYALGNDLIEKAVTFGTEFVTPTKGDKRRHRARHKQANGAKMFQAADVRTMLAVAGPQLRAMIYLGLNCGLGNSDCATLPVSALDFEGGWLDFPRPKTGVERRVPLWPETVKAIQASLATRRQPKDANDAGLVFLTRQGRPWVRYKLTETKDESGKVSINGIADDGIAKTTAKFLTKLGLKRPGLSFYALRHTFETVAGATADQVAVDAIMGHVDSTMAAEYREHIDDARLVAVVNHVRKWLNAKPGKAVRRG